MSESRLRNTISNLSSGLIFRLVSLLINFASRTVFIYVLGEGCLGLNGLFTTILSMFSLAELGIGQAITFYMYKPIAEQDIKRLSVLVSFYKFCYRIIGCVIAVIGILLIPFLPKLINLETDTGYNVILIYLLYLLNTVVTYLFFSYPQTVLSANQKQYITNRVDSIFVIISALAEMIILLLSHNYIMYLVVRVVVAVIKNVVLAVIAIRKYPYILGKTTERLSGSEIKDMFKDVYAIFVVKLSSQLFNSTDNLFISAMFGTVLVGHNSNYLMIINAIYGVIGTVIYSVGASVGNLYVTETKEKTELVFRVTDFINCWISCICTVCLFQLMNPFIAIIWGKQYLFSQTAVALMCANFYIVSSLYAMFSFRQSMGLFQYCIYNQLIAAIVNIILDFILGKIWGIEGLLFATVFANITLAVFPFIKNLYSVGFQMPYKKYLMACLRGYLLCFISAVVTSKICSYFTVDITGFLMMMVVCAVVPNVLQILVLYKSEEFAGAMEYARKVLKR